MNNLTAILGPAPSAFDYDTGTTRYRKLMQLDPSNVLLIPPPGAPSGTVGLQACEALAGPSYGGYGRAQTLDSLATWVVPLLVLVVNLNYASFQLQKYWNEVTIGLHLFGNPIHAMWALLTKLDVKRRIEIRCQDRLLKIGVAQIDISTYSTLLYALDDFNFSRDFQDHFEQLMGIAASGRKDLQNACRRAAVDFTIARVNNTRRAVFALLGYLAAITANVIRADFSGDVSLHYSHTIALRQLNYWLITAIILSAVVGGLPSEWTAVGILKELESKTGLNLGIRRLQPWNGGNYTWRPEKDISVLISGVGDKHHAFLALLAFASVTIAAFISFAISYFSPTRGVGVRSIVELAYWGCWTANAVAMYMVGHWRARWTATERGWLIIIAKDGVLASFTILFVLSAWNGWWNSCYHWSMAIQVGKSRAYVDLVGMKPEILWLMKKRFPIAMALGTAAQLALVFAMIWYAQGELISPAIEKKDTEVYFSELLDRGVRLREQSSIESEISLLKHDVSVSTVTPQNAQVSDREDWEMDSLSPWEQPREFHRKISSQGSDSR